MNKPVADGADDGCRVAPWRGPLSQLADPFFVSMWADSSMDRPTSHQKVTFMLSHVIRPSVSIALDDAHDCPNPLRRDNQSASMQTHPHTITGRLLGQLMIPEGSQKAWLIGGWNGGLPGFLGGLLGKVEVMYGDVWNIDLSAAEPRWKNVTQQVGVTTDLFPPTSRFQVLST